MPTRTLMLGMLLLVAGCGGPNQANVDLRRQNQDLQGKLTALQTEYDAAQAQLAGVATPLRLPTTRGVLSQIFTVHSVKLGSLSAASTHGVKIYVSPRDEEDSPRKATGWVSVDAFDLADPQNRVIEHWDLTPIEIRPDWRSLGPLNAFVLQLPWKTPLTEPKQIGVKVTFRDALTDRVFRLVEKLVWDEQSWR